MYTKGLKLGGYFRIMPTTLLLYALHVKFYIQIYYFILSFSTAILNRMILWPLKNTYEEVGTMKSSQLMTEKELKPFLTQCSVF